MSAFAPNRKWDEWETLEAFDYIRGMTTLALVEEGWEVEGSGGGWVHWVKDDKLIACRASREGTMYLDGNDDELRPLVGRLSRATGWDWVEV